MDYSFFGGFGRLMSLLLLGLLFIACSTDDDCAYCGKDISCGVTYTDGDTVTKPKDADAPASGDVDTVSDDSVDDSDDIADTDGIAVPDEDADSATGTMGEMVEVPAGEFWMGCNEEVDTECFGNESPYHAVTLSSYSIGKYEVTTGEYQKCVDAGACNNDGEEGKHFVAYDENESQNCLLGAPGKENYPMNCVTWYGAEAYCLWAGGRLPTEAEWEKAARGTDGRKYPWGNEPAPSCDNTVMDDPNAGGPGCGNEGPMTVGSKEAGASPYGAYDMLGNVWEWLGDWYGEDYYATSPANDPAGPETGETRSVRGSNWFEKDSYDLRASFRFSGYMTTNYTQGGFRCVK